MTQSSLYAVAISAVLAGLPPAHNAVPITSESVLAARSGSGCAFCSDFLVYNGDNSSAGWSLSTDPCVSGNGCAECVPTCGSSGYVTGVSWAEALAYYNANSCAAYACGGIGPGGEEVELVLSLPVRDQISALALVLHRTGGRVRLNAERHAIQAYGCGDRIVAHYELSAQQSAALQLALVDRR